MPRMLRPLLVAALALAALPAGAGAAPAPCADQDLPIAAGTAARAEASVACLVDAERMARGLPALRSSDVLARDAQGHTDDMLAEGYFDHLSPLAALATPALRATAAGYAWSFIGENIATGQSTPREVMQAWMGSTGHCRNVLSPDYLDLGVGAAPGFAGGGSYGGTWTQAFGRPRDAGRPTASGSAQAGCPYRSLLAPDGAGDPAAPGAAADTAPSGAASPGTAPAAGVPGGSAAGASSRTARATRTTLHVRAHRSGAVVTISGLLRPAAPHAKVLVRVTRAGHGAHRTVHVDHRGRFLLHVHAPRRGALRLSVTGGGVRVVRTLHEPRRR